MKVRVDYLWDETSWCADSPDVPGWLAAANTLEELQALVREGLRHFLKREDIEILERGLPEKWLVEVETHAFNDNQYTFTTPDSELLVG